jgi:flagellar biosynthesis/type III secretory pathway M-ring protein FliF/YscJ
MDNQKPILVNKKILKKLLKKAYNDNSKQLFLNKFSNINNFNINWFYLLVIILIVIIMYQLYCHNKEKKETEMFELQQRIEEQKQYKENIQTDSYEAEYYKMLPRVTNPTVY